MENRWIYRCELEKDIKKGIECALESVKCKHCQHSMLLGRKDRIICTWCHNYIYKNDQVEFKYKMKEMMIKEEKNARSMEIC